MRKTFYQIMLFNIVFLLAIGCSDTKKAETVEEFEPPSLSNIPDYIIDIPAGEELDNYESVLISYSGEDVQAFPLGQFIDFRDTHQPVLYTYQLMAEDGFSPRVRNEPDLFFGELITGYLLPDYDNRAFFPDADIPNVFNVKFMMEIRAYRTVEVFRADGTGVLFQLNEMETAMIDFDSEQVQGIGLSKFISGYITISPSAYNYELISSSVDSQFYSWTELEQGYWLIDNEHSYFPEAGDEMPADKKYFPKLQRITLYQKTTY